MPETAESHAVALTTNRNCVVEVTNLSSVYCLCKPSVHMESGFVFSPPTPTLRTNMSEVCSFTKDDNTASGAVGVMTYQLYDMAKRQRDGVMAVMFSVPFDYNFYENWIGVGIFEVSRACDEKLFKLMYNDKDFSHFSRQKANGSGVKFTGDRLDVRACMSDGGRAIMKLELYDKMS